jgi:signal transduction histidine kinase
LLEYVFQASPIIVFLLILGYTYARLFLLPYAGFQYDFNGVIEVVFSSSSKNDGLQVGDRITHVDNLSWEEYRADRALVLFDGIPQDTSVTLTILRNGESRPIHWIIPGPTSDEIRARLTHVWWLSYFFWFAGLMTYLFARPKGSTWRLLVAFYFLMALLFATRMHSTANVLGSTILSDVLIWIFCAVCWDLHWSFPEVLSNRTGHSHLVLLYTPAVALASLELTPWASRVDEMLALFVTLTGSVLVLVLRFTFNRSEEPSAKSSLGVVLIAFLPALLTGIWLVRDLPAPLPLIGIVYLTWPLIPGIYFYLACRPQLQQFEEQVARAYRLYLIILLAGFLLILISFALPERLSDSSFEFVTPVLIGIVSVIGLGPFFLLPALFRGIGEINLPYLTRMEIRANRWITPYLYVTLLGTAIAFITTLLTHWLTPLSTAPIAIGLLVMFITVAASSVYGRFSRWVDSRLLGIPLSPPKLIEQYVNQISVVLDQDQLVTLLVRHVIPSLFVRQSTLLLINETSAIETLYQDNLAPDLPIVPRAIQPLLRDGQAKQAIHFTEPVDWVRVALPLRANDRLVGLWLLGRRDPDDDYKESDIDVLRALASQTAITLVNIAQARNLHALFQTHIDQQEMERGRLARELHDDVLNRLAVLATAEPQAAARLQTAYQDLSTRLRQVVAGLRPAMLNYGLGTALEELVDELSLRAGTSALITLDLPLSTIRHAPRVEEHLFRVIEQAANNALHHAKARTITISGHIAADEIQLKVHDDGIGFPPGQALDLPGLLLKQHFGLVGMFERASLVGARLEIISQPNAGTTIHLTWHPNATA